MKLNGFHRWQDVLDDNTFDSFLKEQPLYPSYRETVDLMILLVSGL